MFASFINYTCFPMVTEEDGTIINNEHRKKFF